MIVLPEEEEGEGRRATYGGSKISLQGLDKKATAICGGEEKVESVFVCSCRSLVMVLCSGMRLPSRYWRCSWYRLNGME